jgi:hypothetical protein
LPSGKNIRWRGVHTTIARLQAAIPYPNRNLTF